MDTRPSREREAVETGIAGKTYPSCRGFPIWEAPEALAATLCGCVDARLVGVSPGENISARLVGVSSDERITAQVRGSEGVSPGENIVARMCADDG